MDEQKKRDILFAAKVIRDYCREWPETCGTCMLFEMGCKSYNLPRDWEFQGDLPTVEPCPFCGGKAMAYDNKKFVGVGCSACGARIEAGPGVKDSLSAAIERWNRRSK